MTGRSYDGRRDTWRERGSSIFSDDDGDYRRERGSGREEERGFFERAGDEVRSWFGDEQAERRRERDLRRDTEGGTSGGTSYSRTPYGGFGFTAEGSGFGREAGGHGRGGFTGPSSWDDNYRRWREQQIAQFDREYDDYCRERQVQFDQEFDSWRTSRLTAGGTGGLGGRTGDAFDTATTRRGGAAGAGGSAASSASEGTTSEAGAVGEDAGQATRGRGRSGS